MNYNPLYDNDYNNGLYDSPDIDMIDYNPTKQDNDYYINQVVDPEYLNLY
jgi:hypothetical protein